MGPDRWSISDADRALFVQLSGDANPIHADAVAARRQFGGRLLVHGAHLVLAVIDQAVAAGLIDVPSRIVATFHHGVSPDAELRTEFELGADGVITARVIDDVWLAATIGLTPGGPAARAMPLAAVERRWTSRPCTAEDLEQRVEHQTTDTIGLQIDEHLAQRMFPAASDVLGATRLAEIAFTSYVVGMLTPGTHSLSSHYAIDFADAPGDGQAMTSQVARFDARLGRAQLRLVAPGMAADVIAFRSPEPVDQATLLEASPVRPAPNEFAGWRVLVAGGGRGLGEAAARLLTAGGAEVTIAYHSGVDDAQRVATEIGAGCAPLDAPVDDLTHLCWFASPPTSTGVAGRYSQRYHDTLLAAQVTAFETTVAGLTSQPLRGVLWPSSQLLDGAQAGESELIDVKLAGEASCRRLAERGSGVTFVVPRLPPLLTDATRSLVPRQYADTAEALLGALRAMHAG